MSCSTTITECLPAIEGSNLAVLLDLFTAHPGDGFIDQAAPRGVLHQQACRILPAHCFWADGTGHLLLPGNCSFGRSGSWHSIDANTLFTASDHGSAVPDFSLSRRWPASDSRTHSGLRKSWLLELAANPPRGDFMSARLSRSMRWPNQMLPAVGFGLAGDHIHHSWFCRAVGR